MITLEEALLMEIKAPQEPQRMIELIAPLYARSERGAISLEPFPETQLNEGDVSPDPDISLYDNLLSEPPVIIEITHTGGVHSDKLKVRRLIEADERGIVEGFVYDYKKNEWHKYEKGTGKVPQNPSFCDTLHLDLATLL